jgi:hypothetical protein
MTPAAVAYPPLYASGGPAGGQTVAFDPREQGDGLRPKPLLHSGSVGSFQGRQGPGLRPSPGRPVSSLRCGPRQPPLRPLTPFPLQKRSGSATAARRGRFRGRFRKRNLKHAKECSIQQRRGFACGVCRWKRRFGCSRNSAVSAARFESGFRERDGQGQHWRGPHSHGGFLKMIVCESGGHANGLTYFIFRFLRRPLTGPKRP